MTAVAEAIAAGVIGDRLWFYTNYHCNLACRYCLTDSSPRAARRLLDLDAMIDIAGEALGLGYTGFGVTGGEPFLLPDLPARLARLADMAPVVVLSNATLFTDRLLKRMAPLAGRPVAVQVSLDSADADANDRLRERGNHRRVVDAIPLLRAAGLRVRVATTSEGLADDDRRRLCALHRALGVEDEDHVVRPVVRRGRAATEGIGVEATARDLPAELTITADGAFWSPFGPTVRDGRLDGDLLLTRTTRPLSIPAAAMVGVAEELSRGEEPSLGVR